MPGLWFTHSMIRTCFQARCWSIVIFQGPTDNSVLYMLALLRELLPAMGRAQTKVRSKLYAELKIWISQTGFVS